MLLTIFCPVVRSQEHLAPIMSFHLSLFKMVGLHYMPFFACHDCKDNTSSAAGLKTYRIQLSGDELRLAHWRRKLNSLQEKSESFTFQTYRRARFKFQQNDKNCVSDRMAASHRCWECGEHHTKVCSSGE